MHERIQVPEGVERVEIDGFVEAPLDTVWDMWTTVSGLEQWWWPQFGDTSYEVDVREGGMFRFRTATGGFGVQGRYLQLDEGKRIVHTWDWLGGGEELQGEEQLVIVDFIDADGGIHVRVTQTGPIDELDDLQQGWQDTLTRLEEHFDE